MQKKLVLLALLLPLLVNSAFDRLPDANVGQNKTVDKALSLKVHTLAGSIPLRDVDITIFKNGVEVENFLTRYTGKFKYDMLTEAVYEIRFSKAGFVTKTVVFDTQGEILQANNKFGFNLEMIPLEGSEVAERTVAHVFYSNRLNDFTFVKQYTPELLQASAK